MSVRAHIPLFKSTSPSVEGKVPLDTMPSRCTRNFLPVLLHVYVRVICLLGTKSRPRKDWNEEVLAYKHLVVSEMPYI